VRWGRINSWLIRHFGVMLPGIRNHPDFAFEWPPKRYRLTDDNGWVIGQQLVIGRRSFYWALDRDFWKPKEA
jgi:hypothetical protein